MFTGNIVALVTPMLENGEIDFASLDRLLDFHLDNHTDGLVILGTTGEAATLNEVEKKALINFVCKKIAHRIPVIVGVGSNSTQQTIENAQFAQELKIDGLLAVTPYYNKPTQHGLLTHFKALAAKSKLPIILYNVPSRTGCDLLPETVAALAELNNIVGIKEAALKLERYQDLIKLTSGADNFVILTGNDQDIGTLNNLGGQGVISVAANVVPAQISALCQAKATHIEPSLATLFDALFVESNPIPVKWALYKMQLISTPHLRLPLTSLSQKYYATVAQALRNLKLISE